MPLKLNANSNEKWTRLKKTYDPEQCEPWGVNYTAEDKKSSISYWYAGLVSRIFVKIHIVY